MTGIDGRIDSFIVRSSVHASGDGREPCGIANTQGGHFSGYNLSELMFAHRLDDDKHVKLEVWSAPGQSKPTFDEAKKQKYKPAKKGEEFGPSWVCRLRHIQWLSRLTADKPLVQGHRPHPQGVREV